MKTISKKELIGFTSFISGEKLLYVLVTTYASIFYITKLGIDPLFVAALVFITRMFDAINDPFIGAVIDSGKYSYKTYINITAILLPIATIMIFLNPFSAQLYINLYAIVTYVIWSILYTVSEVPIYSIVSTMTDNKQDQEFIMSISTVGSMVGIFFGMFLFAFYLKDGINQIRWIYFAISFATLAFVQMIMTILFVHQKVDIIKSDNEDQLIDILKLTFKNKHLLTIMIIYLAQLFINASAVISAYVYDGYYNAPIIGTIAGIIGMVVIIPMAFLIPTIIKKYGKTNLIYLSCGLMIVSNFIILAFDLSGSMLILLLIISQLAIIIPSILRPLYAQECINFDIKAGNKVNQASSFSLMTFFNKLGDALGASLGSLFLVMAGFNESIAVSSQSYNTLKTLQVLNFLGPILMGITWFIGIKYFYKLKSRKAIEVELLKQNVTNEHIVV